MIENNEKAQINIFTDYKTKPDDLTLNNVVQSQQSVVKNNDKKVSLEKETSRNCSCGHILEKSFKCSIF